MTNPLLRLSYAALLLLACVRTGCAIVTLTYDIVNVTVPDLVFNQTRGSDDEVLVQAQRLRQGFRLEIGTPPQTVWLSPSLILDDIIIRNASSCYVGNTNIENPSEVELRELQQCEWVSQGLFRSELSSSFVDEDDSIRVPPTDWSNYRGSGRSLDGDILDGTEIRENIRFPNASAELGRNNFDDLALHLNSDSYYTQAPGFLGLGEDSVFLDEFFDNNKVFGVSFPKVDDILRVEIDFDGVNTSKSTGEIYSVRFPNRDDDYPFTISVESMDIDGEEILSSPLNFRFDIGHIPGTKFPRDVFYRFSNLTGAYHNELYEGSAFATYNTSVPESLSDQWNLTIRFSNGYVTKIPQRYILQNIIASDDIGQDLPTSISSITMAELADTYATGQLLPGATLGYEILQFSYLMIDYERKQYSIARSVHADRVIEGAEEAAPSNTGDPPAATSSSQSGGNNQNDDTEDPPPNGGNGVRVDVGVLYCMTVLTSLVATVYVWLV
ncbi:hypothetical protein ABW19_dt0201079 [Dactylella cylindrospora]|nr:hypothetical protein ABW19_dt0201079 [Dactylella cylindrospora]